MAEKVSKEEMERQMIINTKKEMFDLGVEHTMNKIKQDNITNKYNNIIRKLFTDQGLSKTDFLNQKLPETLGKLLEKLLNYCYWQ